MAENYPGYKNEHRDLFTPLGEFRITDTIRKQARTQDGDRRRIRQKKIDKMLGKAPPPGPNSMHQEFTPDGKMVFASKLIPPGEGTNRGF
jgi:hypothetical protein